MGFRGGVKSVPSMQLRQDTEQGPAHPQQEKTGGVMEWLAGKMDKTRRWRLHLTPV
jgi:hypothetical protein